MTHRNFHNASAAFAIFFAAVILQGCILVTVTEHRIKVNKNGGGEAILVLTDIRSDAANDTGRARDFGVMMASLDSAGNRGFEHDGNKVTGKRLILAGDTLIAEITYTFPALNVIEGMRTNDDELYVVVGEGKEILKTNGKIKSGDRNTLRIVWPLDAKRLFYQIREQHKEPTASLAPWYRRFIAAAPGGGR